MSPHPAISSSRHPALWPLAVLACLFAFVATHPIRPQDFWFHLAVGRDIVRTGQIPQVDHFSYTVPGKPYPSFNAYWLSDVVLYEIYRLGGPALSVFVHTLVITGTFFLLFLLCRRLSGDSRIAAGAVLVAAALGVDNYNVRPQAVIFPLFVAYLFLIHLFRNQARPSRWWLLAFPAIMLLWTNCHGSSPLGLVLIGVWLVETIWERWRIGPRSRREVWVPVVALVLTAAAMFANPLGLGLLGYLREMNANPVVRHQPEWLPASVATKDGIAFFIVAPLSLALLLWAGRARSGLYHWLMLLGFALLALKTGRAIVWFGLVAAPIASELLPCVLPPRRTDDSYERLPAASPPKSDRAVVAVIMLCFVALMVVTLPWFKDRLPLPEKKAGLISVETPVAATRYLLDHHLPPRVFHNMSYGSYLDWEAYPQYRVFLDSRIELYPASLWDAHYLITCGHPGWQRLLDEYRVNTLLLSRDEQPGLVAAAGASAAWQQVYEDRHAVVLVRKELIRQ
ncbi:MAG: hypothetical protein KKI08_20360 [Armatimonadetes bacterium]|nr:hypothetical protein [Armatimonadota bacterium]